MTAYVIAAMARMKARAALKKDFPTALLLTFFAQLPSLLAQMFAILAVTPVINDIAQHVRDEGTVFLNRWMATFNLKDLLLLMPAAPAAGAVICLVLSFVLKFLHISAINGQLKLLRGEEISPRDALSRAPEFLKAIGLSLWKSLWILIWSLPGIAVSAIGIFAAWRSAQAGGTPDDLFRIMNLSSSLSMTAVLILSVWAALRYMMADTVLADKPDTGVLQALRESRGIMKGKVRLGLMMMLSFLFWYLLIDMLTAWFQGVVGMVIQMGLSIVLSLYLSASVASLYLGMTGAEQLRQTIEADRDSTVE